MPTFSDLGVPDGIATALREQGLTEPFAIQEAALPDALAGRDVAGKAPTGSGKTLAFSIPLAALVGQAQPHRPRALVMTPTRELAAQVKDALAPLAQTRSRRVATFYGGTNIKRDQAALRKGVDVVVATPGRLEDLVQRGDCDLREVDLVVLDEADRMADMGFLPVVKRLLDTTSKDRQTLLFSATLDGDVDVLVRRYQHDPARHEVEGDEADLGDVRHLFWHVDRQDRRDVTTDVLRKHGPAIVFTRTKHGADRLAKQLKKSGVPAAAIHGNRSQNQRERALSQFADGSVATLVATDVAARGIHVDDVALVLHYDLPATDKDYVHRSGRTGRAGSDGVVLSMVMEDQHKDAASIQRKLDLPQGANALDVSALGEGTVHAARPSTDGSSSDSAQRSNGNSNSNSNGRSTNNGGGRGKGGGRGGNGKGGNRRRTRSGRVRAKGGKPVR